MTTLSIPAPRGQARCFQGVRGPSIQVWHVWRTHSPGCTRSYRKCGQRNARRSRGNGHDLALDVQIMYKLMTWSLMKSPIFPILKFVIVISTHVCTYSYNVYIVKFETMFSLNVKDNNICPCLYKTRLSYNILKIMKISTQKGDHSCKCTELSLKRKRGMVQW